MIRWVAVPTLVALAACGSTDNPEAEAPAAELTLDQTRTGQADDETLNIDDIEEIGDLPADLTGVTPMAERVAVLGLLNKRNGLSREIRLSPGESTRVGDVLIRLRACEETAPWEPQRLTGAFVQLFVRQTARGSNEESWERVFSGWLFKERPSLNVIEHRLYDVWPKACEMTYPDNAPSSSASSGNSRSSAARPAPAAEPVEPVPDSPTEDSAASSNDV
ncbi:uncharacterized protein DUF2155 [Parasphingopyxis lamellibrachiae]|uniref:Uncharacterized protein DUF2155 n=1 Tax=Parasphingopyxis lamellibrachiae TaxID=680125 RepID=A0A3D9FBJ2_9SPHN|nr:uncharacterized protein DUF2155 [Parasphingopyxis lamellibrachiae]